MDFRLTYATMFDPPETVHDSFTTALTAGAGRLGAVHPMVIGGRDRFSNDRLSDRSPIDQRHLGDFCISTPADVHDSLVAAAEVAPAWRQVPWRERVALSRRTAEIIEERVFDFAAALVLETGKNRMEALAEAAEVVDFFRVYADEFERHDGYLISNPDDPVVGFTSRNTSVLRPYGPWAIVAPFNYPFALAAGPVAAALVTGNPVVFKAASQTPWLCAMFAEALRDAGYPDGTFSHVIGSGSSIGRALIEHPLVAGVTFTGSYDVGMGIARWMTSGAYPRPCIAEMGGKNPAIVSDTADVERAALGITRSAFGMGGQKCSALSRVYVHHAVADELLDRLVTLSSALVIGDPTDRATYLGPVTTRGGFDDYATFVERLGRDGAHVVSGGKRLSAGGATDGFYVEPTIAEAPASHPLWQVEMFLPIVMVHRTGSNEESMRLANDVPLGLTAGFYGAEIDWFCDRIEAGTTYVNRPQGATTGAWPGYQAFGGWKGSTTTGKAIGSAYYLPLYLREQSRTIVD
jgi:acyl-CoA reductase-like NAD-dependent aldehyde dehydrogenase